MMMRGMKANGAMAPGHCARVAGRISPMGYCLLFDFVGSLPIKPLDFERALSPNIQNMAPLLSIQEAAVATGLSTHTLRYYERIGLIDPILRQANGHRFYRPEDLQWIAFLTRLRSTGMSIERMARYAALRRLGDDLSSVSARKRMLDQHTAALEDKLVALQETLTALHAKVAFYVQKEEALKALTNNPQKKATFHGKRKV